MADKLECECVLVGVIGFAWEHSAGNREWRATFAVDLGAGIHTWTGRGNTETQACQGWLSKTRTALRCKQVCCHRLIIHADGRRGGNVFLRLSVCLSARYFKDRCSSNHHTWHRNVPPWVLETHLLWDQKIRKCAQIDIHSHLQTLSKDVFIRADYAFSALDMILFV